MRRRTDVDYGPVGVDSLNTASLPFVLIMILCSGREVDLFKELLLPLMPVALDAWSKVFPPFRLAFGTGGFLVRSLRSLR